MSKTGFRTDSMKKAYELLSFTGMNVHIFLCMKTKTLMVVAAMLSMASAAYAGYDCQVASNDIGDWNLVTIGGYTFAKSISLDLAPTNAPKADARYSIRCQVVYQDRNLPRPKTEKEMGFARATGGLLNIWLKEFVAEQYVGAEYSDLLSKYCDGRFTEDLNVRFPAYVVEKIAEMDEDERVDVAAVTVTVNAEGEFQADLVELWRQQTSAQQKICAKTADLPERTLMRSGEAT